MVLAFVLASGCSDDASGTAADDTGATATDNTGVIAADNTSESATTDSTSTTGPTTSTTDGTDGTDGTESTNTSGGDEPYDPDNGPSHEGGNFIDVCSEAEILAAIADASSGDVITASASTPPQQARPGNTSTQT